MYLLRAIYILVYVIGFTLPVRAEAPPNVVVSIPPLHSLAAALLEGVGEPTLLLEAGFSPHAYALKPSSARRLAKADLVFWAGPELETFLEKFLKTLEAEKGGKVHALLHAPEIYRLKARAGHEENAVPEEDGENEGSQEDRGGEMRIDPHFWLDPENALLAATVIANRLAEADPAREEIYRRNLTKLGLALRALDSELTEKFRPIAGIPYLAFHDAYAYLDRRYGLGPSEAIAIDPERRAGTRRLIELRKTIAKGGFRCLFHEPQFVSALVDRLAEGTDLRVDELDPLGSGFAPGPKLYFEMMRKNASHLARCLRPAGSG